MKRTLLSTLLVGIAGLSFGQDLFEVKPSRNDSDTYHKIAQFQAEIARLQRDLKQKEIAVAAQRVKLQSQLAGLAKDAHQCDQCHTSNGLKSGSDPFFGFHNPHADSSHGPAFQTWTSTWTSKWYLGVHVAPPKTNESPLAGAVVTRVLADSPAAASGLQAEDVILSCNGIRVDSASLREIVNAAQDQELTLEVRRGEQVETLKIKVTPKQNLKKTHAPPTSHVGGGFVWENQQEAQPAEERDPDPKELQREVRELRKLVEAKEP